jgi:hypothetical protein
MILGGVDPCLAPQAVIERVGAAPVAARDKRARELAMTLKRPNRIACRDEFCSGFRIMNQNQIGIVVHGRLKRQRCSSARIRTVIPVFL